MNELRAKIKGKGHIEYTRFITIDGKEITYEELESGILEALRGAKESGEFDGVSVSDVFFDEENRLNILLSNGDSYLSNSLKGDPGRDYVLTDGDKAEIAETIKSGIKTYIDESITDFTNKIDGKLSEVNNLVTKSVNDAKTAAIDALEFSKRAKDSENKAKDYLYSVNRSADDVKYYASNAISEINLTKVSAHRDIDNQKNDAINAINRKQEETLSAVESAKEDAIEEIENSIPDIDSINGANKSLDNLDANGEKRFTDLKESFIELENGQSRLSESIAEISNTGETKAPSGKVWTTTENGAEWKTPTGSGSEEDIKNAVNEYLDAHPIQPYDDTEIRSNLISKAARIENTVSATSYTILDGSDNNIINLVVHGHTEQVLSDGYNLTRFEDVTFWYNQGGKDNLSYSVDNDKQDWYVEALAESTGTMQVQAYNSIFHPEEWIGIESATLHIDSYELSRPDMLSPLVSVIIYKAEGGSIEIGSYPNTNGEINVSKSIGNAQISMVRFLVRLRGSAANPIRVGDSIKLKGFRLTKDISINKYTVKNSVNPVVSIGSQSVEIPYILRGIPDVNGNISYDGSKYICDSVDISEGTLTKRISDAVDMETYEKISNWSQYILSEPIIEQISTELKEKLSTLKTSYNGTFFDSNVNPKPMIEIEYISDTKKYIDNNNGKDSVTPEDFGAAGDGISDDTEALVSAMNRGGNVTLGLEKTYKCRPIELNLADDISIDGNGSTLILDNSNISTENKSTAITAVGVGDICLKNLIINCNASNITIGNTISPASLGGIELNGYNRVELINVTVKDTLTGAGAKLNNCKHVVVDGCIFDKMGHPEIDKIVFPNYEYGGISAFNDYYDGSDFTVRNSQFFYCAAACVNPVGYETIIVEDNYFYNAMSYQIEHAFIAKDINTSVIVRNNFSCNCRYVLYGNSVHDTSGNNHILIDSNVIKDSGCGDYYKNLDNIICETLCILTADNQEHTINASIDIINNNIQLNTKYAKDKYKNSNVSFGVALIKCKHIVIENNRINLDGEIGYIASNMSLNDTDESSIIVKNNLFMNGVIITDNTGKNATCGIYTDNVFMCDDIEGVPFFIRIRSQKKTIISNNVFENGNENMPSIDLNNNDIIALISSDNKCKKLINITGNGRVKGYVLRNIADTDVYGATSLSDLVVKDTLPYTL